MLFVVGRRASLREVASPNVNGSTCTSVSLHAVLWSPRLRRAVVKCACAQGGGGATGAGGEEARPTITMPGATAGNARYGYADDDDRPPSAGVSTRSASPLPAKPVTYHML